MYHMVMNLVVYTHSQNKSQNLLRNGEQENVRVFRCDRPQLQSHMKTNEFSQVEFDPLRCAENFPENWI